MQPSLEILKDISVATEIWKNLLKENWVKFAYAKGSAFKPIQSYLDYVPLVSDIDIHLEYPEYGGNLESLDMMLHFAEDYYTEFTLVRPDYVHVPRMQLVDIKNLDNKNWYFPPSLDEITVLFGEQYLNYPERSDDDRYFIDGTHLNAETLRQVDAQRMSEEAEFLRSFPATMIDRTGIDLWSGFRKLNYRVAPSVFRVIAKHSENPVQVWGFNRTTAYDLLTTYGYTDLANDFAKYYKLGWIQFENGMQDDLTYFRMIKLGYKIVLSCFNILLSKS